MQRGTGERRRGQIADWHTAKIFTIVQVIALLGGMAAGIWYLTEMSKDHSIVAADVARHEREIVQLQRSRIERDTELNAAINAMRLEQKNDTQRLEDKLDRLMMHFLGSTRP